MSARPVIDPSRHAVIMLIANVAALIVRAALWFPNAFATSTLRMVVGICGAALFIPALALVLGAWMFYVDVLADLRSNRRARTSH